jgi:hypothetical protein
MKYLTIQQIVRAEPEVVANRVDPLIEALLSLEAADSDIEDPDLAADLTTGQVDVQMVIEAATPPEAMMKAFSTLRAAIHAIGDGTAGWDAMLDAMSMHVMPAHSADSMLAGV